MGACRAPGGRGRVSNGLILGRFMPPHLGHMLLAETAAALVDRLTILFCWRDDDPIPGDLRALWLEEMFPYARIVGFRGPDLHDDPAGCWRAAIEEHHPERIDTIFASDEEGVGLARDLGIRFVLVDPTRNVVPTTSQAILADPFAYWGHLPPVVKPWFARSICLHGPESTGKSTLAPALARHLDTIHMPEYGRTYCENFGLALQMRDLVEIGRTQAAMTRAGLRQCNRRLILDTDPLMTAAWADMLFDRRDPWFDAFDETADLYLLLDIDMPWVDDGTRFFGDDGRRRRFFDLSRAELDRRGLNYVIIGGPPEERLAHSIAAIEAAGI
jgi:NadR type nicotinamide-nucleotide adenylyltransferase